MKNGDMPAIGHAGQTDKNGFSDAPGLTKRELIAAMALQGLLAGGWDHSGVPRGGFTGMKPDAWVDWVLDMLTYTPGDVVVDLFPGSGQVGRAVARRQVLEVSNG